MSKPASPKILDTLARMAEARIAAIIRAPDESCAGRAMEAAIAGGFRVLEFTLNTPGAFSLIRAFSARPELVIGAGTVMHAADVAQAVEAGARFIVSPHTDPTVIAETRRRESVSIPGAATPTEMLTAVQAGADVVKLFPAPHDLPRYLRQVLGPLPHLRILPTAGVDADNFLDILDAGAFGAAFVSSLFTPGDLANGDFDAIRDRAADIHRRLARHRAATGA